MTTVVLISADAEWRVVKRLFPDAEIKITGMGEFFWGEVGTNIVFFHGGWGKISAAATAQYVIDHFHPDLIINPGTCGGFEGRIDVGTVILVEKTIVYDIIEQMGNPDDAIEHYSTHLDLSWLTVPYPSAVWRGVLVSADRDIIAREIPELIERYSAVAADWESGAIAWVSDRNHVRCVILRAVTDLVSNKVGEAYGNLTLFHIRTDEIMPALIHSLGGWIQAAGG